MTLRELAEAIPESYRDSPWHWFGQKGYVYELATDRHGRLFIMGFERMGMRGAQPSFAHLLPGDEHHLMTKATELAQLEQPYRGDIVGFDNPFARWIAAANPHDVLELIKAFEDAYAAMDAATKWAAHQRPEHDTVEAAGEHVAGYDALLDAQVRAGRALGILR